MPQRVTRAPETGQATTRGDSSLVCVDDSLLAQHPIGDGNKPFDVPLEGLEPPTLSLGRNCSSIELQRLTRP
jgi:hypothetical protein